MLTTASTLVVMTKMVTVKPSQVPGWPGSFLRTVSQFSMPVPLRMLLWSEVDSPKPEDLEESARDSKKEDRPAGWLTEKGYAFSRANSTVIVDSV